MPYILLDLQLFADEGMAETGEVASSEAGNPVGDGVATETAGDQAAPETGNDESWESLIKGKFKEDYNKSMKDAIAKRFKNQRDLQGQVDALDPMVKALAQRYKVQNNPDGSIPIDALISKVMDDNSMYEEEAFQRGMSVDDLKQIKALERENMQLKAAQQRNVQRENWDALVQEGEAMKEMYPEFDLNQELDNENFGKLLTTLQRSGIPNAVRTAFETVHRDDIMGGAMRYAVQQTKQKISNSIQSGMARPQENGTNQRSPGTPTNIDPSKLTKKDIEDYKMRAMRGEIITFH